MKVEEAAITGESVPVNKIMDILYLEENALDISLGDRTNMLYSGSTVVYGRGKAVVVATGMDTQMGKIADALQNSEDEQTPLQKKMAEISKVLTKLIVAISIFVFIFGINISFILIVTLDGARLFTKVARVGNVIMVDIRIATKIGTKILRKVLKKEEVVTLFICFKYLYKA